MNEIAAPEGTALAVPLDAARIEGTRYDLSPRVSTLWLWQSLVLGVVPALPLSLVGIVAGRPAVLLAAPIFAVLMVLLGIVYHRAYLRHFRCVLLPDGVLLKRGVLWRNETFVPRPRIQHTDVSQGPIARHFDIATIKIFTAGSTVGQLQVEGLSRDRAIELRDRLLGREVSGSGHDAV